MYENARLGREIILVWLITSRMQGEVMKTVHVVVVAVIEMAVVSTVFTVGRIVDVCLAFLVSWEGVKITTHSLQVLTRIPLDFH